MTLVDFLGPGSNIFPGMSGEESDWSEGQLLRNTNHIDRMMALKIPRYDCSLCLTFSTELHLSESFMKVRQTISVRLAITEFVKGKEVFVCLPTGEGKSLCFGTLPAV